MITFVLIAIFVLILALPIAVKKAEHAVMTLDRRPREKISSIANTLGPSWSSIAAIFFFRPSRAARKNRTKIRRPSSTTPPLQRRNWDHR